MRICNGFTLLCALPRFAPDGTIDCYSIAAVQDRVKKTGVRYGEVVSAYMKTLDDNEWYWGEYFNVHSETHDNMPLVIRRAVRRAYVRACAEVGESIPAPFPGAE